MRRALHALVFLALIAETAGMFADHWQTPLRALATFLFEWKPLVAPMIDLILLGMLLLAPDQGKKPASRGLERAMAAATLGLVAWTIWGLARGGLFYQVQFQLHAMLVAFLCVLVFRKLLHTPEHFYALGKVIIAAALFRAVMCIAFYVLVLRRGVLDPPPEFITTHDDTVLFVSAVVAVVVHALLRPSPRSWRTAAWVGAIVLLGILFNNRRLAWVSLTGSFVLVYLMLADHAARRRVNRLLFMAVPVLLLYAAVGWGRSESVFKPLRALHTVSGEVDPSTRSRDAENQGLLVTLTRHPIAGTGYGHEYIEVDNTLSAGTAFSQYRYLPHNSVLALLAFAGLLGFTITWMIFPVWVYVSAHVYRHAGQPLVKIVALTSLCEVVICLSQWWGDMGMISFSAGLLMAAGIAAASRMTDYVGVRR